MIRRFSIITFLIIVGFSLTGYATYRVAGEIKCRWSLWRAVAVAAKTYRELDPLVRSSATETYRPVPAGSLTFSREIAPIVHDKCATCHQPGNVAPFSLITYHDLVRKRRMVAKVLKKHLMPPWKPVSGVGEFLGDFSLTVQERGMIMQWIAEGCLEGNPAEKLPMPQASEDWAAGEPDAVLSVTEDFAFEGEGDDEYRCFVIPTDFPEDRYVRAVDIRPGNKAIMHHALVFTDTTGTGRSLDEKDSAPGYRSFGTIGFEPTGTLGCWVPGMKPVELPDGVGYLLPKGGDVIVQVHYKRSGKVELDSTQMALYFWDRPVDKQVRVLTVATPPNLLRIPAGSADYLASGSRFVPGDITVIGLFPHMHLLGREMVAAAIRSNGETIPMLRIDDWDFDWQSVYMLKRGLRLESGSRVTCVAKFDNSEENPRNPNTPPLPVSFGIETTSEMMLLCLYYIVDNEYISRGQRMVGYPDSFVRFSDQLAPCVR